MQTTIYSRIRGGAERNGGGQEGGQRPGLTDHMGLVDCGEALGRHHMGLMSFQAAEQLGPTQMVKILSQTTPTLILDQGNAKVVQLIVLEIFATDKDSRPLFTLGIVSSVV